MEITNKKELLDKIYHNPESPAGFAGSTLLYREAKKLYPTITKRDVHHYLTGDRTYTLHKPRRIKFKRTQTIPLGLFSDLQIDLAMMEKLSRHNRGYKYILLGVDVLSKMLFAEPIKSKKYQDVATALDAILSRIPIKPQRIFSDRGTEFILKEKIKTRENNKQIIKQKDFYEERDIDKLWSRRKEIKAALAERYIRVLKSRIYRYFSEMRTLNWVDVLQKIIDAINHSPSRSIGMRPVDVTFANAQQLWEKQYGGFMEEHQKKKKFNESEYVRKANSKELFDRGYLVNWSDELYKIKSIKPGNPVNTFKIEDESGRQKPGLYYKEELGHVRKNAETSYRIEKVLKKRKNKQGEMEYRVKFIGYDIPEWIKESDFVN